MYKILNNILEMDDYSLQRLSKSSKLPSEYQQIEYIESTGTQYIDTGINPISSTRIDINFAYVGTTSSFEWNPILGSRSMVDNVQEYYAVFINNRTLKLTTNYSFRDVADNSTVYIEANKKYNLKNNQGSFYINDILESSISISDTLSNNTRYPVYLFDLCNYGARLNRGTKMKLYSCKFYDGDTLIRNYIPCYRKSDNEIGLYDIVNNVFYTNQGTGKFIAGGYLPSEYQQIEYIESTGTQYIDTGFIPTFNTKISADFKSNKVSGEPFTSLFGTQKSTDNGRFYCLFGTTNNVQINIPSSMADYIGLNNDGTYASGVGTFFSNNRTNYIMDISNKIIQIENKTWNLSSYYTDYVSPDYNLFILTRNSSGIADKNCSKGLLYSVKIWDDNTLIRNFIPCYRKSDNVAGMYDLVTNTFFTNAGTGEFTYGSISLALSTPVGVKGIGDRTKDLSFTDFNNWESEQYDINENKDIEEIEQIKAPNILSDTYTSITADTEVQPNQVDFIPKAIDENKASEPTIDELIPNNAEE